MMHCKARSTSVTACGGGFLEVGRDAAGQVYGALPPEARAQQAALFNAPRTGFNVLVASDAIGMGLNLNIRSACKTCTGPHASSLKADAEL